MIVPGTSNEMSEFQSLFKCEHSDGEEVTSDGQSFHIRAPPIGKVWRPTVDSLTAGTNRLSVTEDRSPCWEGMSRWCVWTLESRLLQSVTMQRPIQIAELACLQTTL